MSDSIAELSPERDDTLPILELDASMIVPMESAHEKGGYREYRPWWVLTFELVLAAAILLFFL